MIEAKEFDGREIEIVKQFREVEDFAIADMAERFLERDTGLTRRQKLKWKTRETGKHREAVGRKVNEIKVSYKKGLKKTMEEIIEMSWLDDMEVITLIGLAYTSEQLAKSVGVQKTIDDEYSRTINELDGILLLMLDQSEQDMSNLADKADMRSESGNGALLDVLDSYASDGMKINYPDDSPHSVDYSVRCAVTTALNQTTSELTNQCIKETGCQYVLVSAHVGARVQRRGYPYIDGHVNWQGKVYKITGSEPGYPNLLESTGYDIDPETGEGHVVDMLGLHGYNCRHSHTLWAKGLDNPYEDENGNLTFSKEDDDAVKVEEVQRRMESNIRRNERRANLKNVEAMYTEGEQQKTREAQYEKILDTLSKQYDTYFNFCHENKIEPRIDNEQE